MMQSTKGFKSNADTKMFCPYIHSVCRMVILASSTIVDLSRLVDLLWPNSYVMHYKFNIQ
jgi:hypothetical protein